jgi:hypothetical protein
MDSNCAQDKLLLMMYQKERLDFKLVVESIYGVEFEYCYSTNTQKNITNKNMCRAAGTYPKCWTSLSRLI